MTTVSRVSQVSHTNVAGTRDWDHRLNRLLEDLQETVIPSDTKLGNANEYREFRMTQRTQVNDEPAQQVDEKWCEYGTRGGGTLSIPPQESNFSSTGGGTTTRFGEKSVAFSDDFTSNRSYESRREPPVQVEYLAPANTTTVLKSGPSSPTGYTTSTSPKVERKEFYAKASYTTLIKGGGNELVPQLEDNRAERLLEDLIPSDFRSPPAMQSSSTSSETTKRTYITESNRRGLDEPVGQPLYASTPITKSSINTRESRDYNRELITDRNTTRSVTPPPKPAEALKTPPMIRKILQSSQQSSSCSSSNYHQHQHSKHTTSSSTSGTSGRPPAGGVPLPILHSGLPRSGSDNIPAYDEPPERPAARYYTSTTTTEHRTDREVSPVKRFPSSAARGPDGEPPKRLDELLATFGDTSYSESSTQRYVVGDGSGAHKSIPYGPGTQPIQALRSVRIDDNVQQRQMDDDAELIHRKSAKKMDLETRNVAGPPVYFPPGQIFQKTEEEALMTSQEGGKGKGKMKAKREYKEKEKMKSKHSEKGGQGAVPVPVCLPVCCAAPCVIM